MVHRGNFPGYFLCVIRYRLEQSVHLRYVGHTALSIEIATKRILTDPWWNGPVYSGQWHPQSSKKVAASEAENVDIVLLSQGREDHMHLPTLRLINKNALIVLPLFVHPHLRDVIRSLGFCNIIEVAHSKTKQLAPGILVSCYIEREKGVFVLQGEGRTLVNVNDALRNASTPRQARIYSRIRKNHPRIDHLFVSRPSEKWIAEYSLVDESPNRSGKEAVSEPAKSKQVGFESQWSRLIDWLQPRQMFRFTSAPEFAEADFNSTPHHRVGSFDTQVIALSPGDCLVGDQYVPRTIGSEYLAGHDIDLIGSRSKLSRQVGGHEELNESQILELLSAMQSNADERCGRVLHPDRSILCRIDLIDYSQMSIMVEASNGNVTVSRCDASAAAPMILTTCWDVLRGWVFEDYGYQAITVAQGAHLHLCQEDVHLRCTLIKLLGRKPLPPTWSQRLALWLRHPHRKLSNWQSNAGWPLFQ